jgi:hypothetical protein
MKTTLTLACTFALLLSTAARAQQSPHTFDFRVVAEPSTVIGGYTLPLETKINSVALNDSGEVLFYASLQNGDGVFTSRRLIAQSGAVVGGKTIIMIPDDPHLAINARGQCAFEAWYVNAITNVDYDEPDGFGIFVDNRLVSNFPPTFANFPVFTLTDDGRVVVQGTVPSPTQPAQRAKPGFASPLKMPKGFPKVPTRIQPGRFVPMAEKAQSPLPFPINKKGQVLIPVNLEGRGFLLLLGTPVAR